MLPPVATTVATVDAEELEVDVDEELVLVLVFLLSVVEIVGVFVKDVADGVEIVGVEIVGVSVPAVFSKQLQALLTAVGWMSANWVATVTDVVERYSGQKVTATVEKRSNARSALFS